MQKIKVCKKCGAQMDSSAKACPQCGAPAKKPIGLIIGIIIFLVIIIPVMAAPKDGGSTETAATGSQTENTSSAAQPAESAASAEESQPASESAKETSSVEPASEPAKETSSVEPASEPAKEASSAVSSAASDNNVFHVGETLDTGKVKVTMTSYEDYVSDNPFLQPEDGKAYFRAYFVVENTGNTDMYTTSFDFDCYADNSAADTPMLSDGLFTGGTISPGRKSEGYVYFEIPANSSKIEIEYEISLWTQKKAVFIVKE